MLAACRGGRVEAGGAAHRADGAVGLSNVFAPTGHLEAAWLDCVAGVAAIVPDGRIVGYESGDQAGLPPAPPGSPPSGRCTWIRD